MTNQNKPSTSSISQTIGRMDSQTEKNSKVFRVMSTRNLTDSSYVIRFDKNSIDYQAGQHLTLGIPGDHQLREYSIYSPNNVDYLEVLIKEVDNGYLSKKLHRIKKGDTLQVDGPFGFFTLDEDYASKKYLFVATGTGIAPFHSIVGSHPKLNFKLIHGVRTADEAYERDFYPEGKYVACTSRDSNGDFHGRVNDYLEHNEIDSDTFVYLCGNCDMIYEVYDLLTSRGIDAEKIKIEVYF